MESNFGNFRRKTGYPIKYMLATGWDGAWREPESADWIDGEVCRTSAGLNERQETAKLVRGFK